MAVLAQLDALLEFGQQIDALRAGFIAIIVSALAVLAVAVVLIYVARSMLRKQGTEETDAESESKREDTLKISVDANAQMLLQMTQNSRELGKIIAENTIATTAQTIASKEQASAFKELSSTSIAEREAIRRELATQIGTHENAAAQRMQDMKTAVDDGFKSQNDILIEVKDTLKKVVEGLQPVAEINKVVRLLEKLTPTAPAPLEPPS